MVDNQESVSKQEGSVVRLPNISQKRNPCWSRKAVFRTLRLLSLHDSLMRLPPRTRRTCPSSPAWRFPRWRPQGQGWKEQIERVHISFSYPRRLTCILFSPLGQSLQNRRRIREAVIDRVQITVVITHFVLFVSLNCREERVLFPWGG